MKKEKKTKIIPIIHAWLLLSIILSEPFPDNREDYVKNLF